MGTHPTKKGNGDEAETTMRVYRDDVARVAAYGTTQESLADALQNALDELDDAKAELRQCRRQSEMTGAGE